MGEETPDCSAALCRKVARFACSNCQLLQVGSPFYANGATILAAFSIYADTLCSRQYCEKSCQIPHRPERNSDCRSPYLNTSWWSAWVLDYRTPSYAKERVAGYRSNAWWLTNLLGSASAIDIFRFEYNEGKEFGSDIRSLFAGMFNARLAFWRL